jgi:hypothetical protein
MPPLRFPDIDAGGALLTDVDVARLDPGRFEAVLDPDSCRRFARRLEQAAGRLRGRRLWQLNSTSQGGGVAEMLQFLLGYLNGAQIDARWVVIDGDEEFFSVTKRIHNLLHGQPGDGQGLGEPERSVYEQTLRQALQQLAQRIAPGDVVVLHDPQTAGLIRPMKQAGAAVIWSCHVGIDAPNDMARTAWDFLRPDVQAADAYVFSRPAYRWEGLGPDKLAIIPPCIDAFSPKNQPLDRGTITAILHAAGILDSSDGEGGNPDFRRLDGSLARVGGAPRRSRAGPCRRRRRWCCRCRAGTASRTRWGAAGVRRACARAVGGTSGDPSDLASFGGAIGTLLDDPEAAARFGREAHRRVRDDYLAPRRLTQEMDLIEQVADQHRSPGWRAGAAGR